VFESTSTARDHSLGERQQNWQPRKLDDGREFKVVKVFYEPEQLVQKLAEFGFEATAGKSGRYFIYATGIRK
jgi:demethylmenaquinone methyltransferase/2-methoxy-6-polyprenyl-1,4-benzoquinol methylase